MASLIETLAKTLEEFATPDLRIEHHTSEMLVTLPTAPNRTQTVKITVGKSRRDDQSLLTFVSRACVARDYRWVNAALKLNTGDILPGLAMDMSVAPPVINVVYNMPAKNIQIREFIAVLNCVARSADRLEQRTTGGDEF